MNTRLLRFATGRTFFLNEAVPFGTGRLSPVKADSSTLSR
jgi:hypothetical protein